MLDQCTECNSGRKLFLENHIGRKEGSRHYFSHSVKLGYRWSYLFGVESFSRIRCMLVFQRHLSACSWRINQLGIWYRGKQTFQFLRTLENLSLEWGRSLLSTVGTYSHWCYWGNRLCKRDLWIYSFSQAQHKWRQFHKRLCFKPDRQWLAEWRGISRMSHLEKRRKDKPMGILNICCLLCSEIKSQCKMPVDSFRITTSLHNFDLIDLDTSDSRISDLKLGSSILETLRSPRWISSYLYL